MATSTITSLLSRIFSTSRRLVETDDMNNLPNGLYRQSNTILPQNYPPVSDLNTIYNAFIFQFGVGGLAVVRFQLWVSTNGHCIYYRTSDGSGNFPTTGGWYKLIGDLVS